MKEQTEEDLKLWNEQAMNAILKEHLELIKNVDFKAFAKIISPIKRANAIFFIGMGRSGLMMKAAAMRLMHLGFEAYVVGETTTPAIGKGDLLIAGSGSGTTTSVLRAVETAKKVNADVIGFTTDAESPMAKKADYNVILPAAKKQQHQNNVSEQYAGSLFEQALLLYFDSLIQTLWKIDGSSAETLYERHANME